MLQLSFFHSFSHFLSALLLILAEFSLLFLRYNFFYLDVCLIHERNRCFQPFPHVGFFDAHVVAFKRRVSRQYFLDPACLFGCQLQRFFQTGRLNFNTFNSSAGPERKAYEQCENASNCHSTPKSDTTIERKFKLWCEHWHNCGLSNSPKNQYLYSDLRME